MMVQFNHQAVIHVNRIFHEMTKQPSGRGPGALWQAADLCDLCQVGQAPKRYAEGILETWRKTYGKAPSISSWRHFLAWFCGGSILLYTMLHLFHACHWLVHGHLRWQTMGIYMGNYRIQMDI